MTSLSENIIWNSIRVGSNLLFPIVTFPYVTRVLGPEMIVTYNYINAIVSYFILFANLGFPLYGTREVARERNQKETLEKTVSSIFTANVLSTLVVTLLYVLFCLFYIQNDLALHWLIGLSLLLNCISFDWFYQGLENFRYITIRSLIFRIISIVLLFLLVDTKEDLILFAGINIFAMFGSNICNLYFVTKNIKLKFSLSNNIKHIKGAFTLFLGSIIVSLYTQLNTVMLGTLDTVVAVAFFTTANKLIQLVLSIINAIQSAIIPRISFLIGENNNNDATLLQRKILNVILYLSIPFTVGIYIMADNLILIFGGKEFMPAAKILKILSFLIIIISLSGFMGFHVLYPHKKEKLGNRCTIIGSCTNLILNFILIKNYSYIGIACSVLISEILVTVTHYYYSRYYMSFRIKDFIPQKPIIATIVMAIILIIIPTTTNIICILKIIIAIFVYICSLYFMKDSFLKSLITTITNIR